MTVQLSRPERGAAGRTITERLALSATAPGQRERMDRFRRWFSEMSAPGTHEVRRMALEDLARWEIDPLTGDIRHDSGRFFAVHGLDVRSPAGPVPRWSQPIISQPEVGILGFLATELDGILHLLVQAKAEPGNCNGLQLSPTVQATRSNYMRVHGGKPVPYLDHFRDARRHRIVADVRQSEQGAWFDRKRNRNMIVEVDGEVERREDFHWLTLRQMHELLTVPDLVNMDARTVLSCLPMSEPSGHAPGGPADGPGPFRHRGVDLLSWLTGVRTETELETARAPLAGLPGWRWRDGAIGHESGRFFEVVGVDVRSGRREVTGWTQPMIAPVGRGVVGALLRWFDGVPHLLMHARAEPGCMDVVELAPTVQCTPDSLDALPGAARPRFLDAVLGAPPSRVRFDCVLSEEGGRFLDARNRYLIVEDDGTGGGPDEGPDHRWVAEPQLVELLRHSHYLNVQARTIVACLHAAPAAAVTTGGGPR